MADTVYGYTANLNRSEIAKPNLSRIAHKYASLGITLGQDTTVDCHSIASIGEVLGEGVNKEALAAWNEAY
ncbi:hypothetical protein [Iodobacter fluviatilis]|uniref:Uncharacterized protein n=1 Tax=Iodobacter fluviatilis TaxID=537 RepID=A0A7G3GE16_9NEIS|nr:hypothetical protein [Iodobacter fluviatilis]QBC45408.1 hypothetical protein C1H71_18955 [Iodobacter fluviatilis]